MPKKILLLDDLAMAEDIAEGLPATVDVTETAAKAIRMLSETHYDVLIIEPYDGPPSYDDAVSRIDCIRQANEQGSIVIVTSSQSPETLCKYGLEGLESAHHLIKPYSTFALYRILQRNIGLEFDYHVQRLIDMESD